MTEVYEVISHFEQGKNIEPVVKFYSERPDIERMNIPVDATYVEILSSVPLEYKLQFRQDASCDCPDIFQNFYFPNSMVLSYQDIISKATGDEDEIEYYQEMAKYAANYNYCLAGGRPCDEQSIQECNFIVTSDIRLFAFAANCALLLPVQGFKSCTKKWDKITLPLYHMKLADSLNLS